MDEVAWGPIVTMGLAALSGLSYIAYKHPLGYSKLNIVLTAAICLVLLAMMGWDAGVTAAVFAVRDSTKPIANRGDIMEVVNAARLPAWSFIIPTAVVGYLLFLSSFPMWLLDKEEPTEKEGDTK